MKQQYWIPVAILGLLLVLIDFRMFLLSAAVDAVLVGLLFLVLLKANKDEQVRD